MNKIASIGDKPDAWSDLLELDVGLLPVGATFRPPLGHYEVPRDVRSAGDLPSRLYLGTLLPDSFRATSAGWAVRYEDTAPDTYVDLQYKAPRGPLIGRYVWAGIEGMSTCTSGSDWRGLIQQMSVIFPQTWEEKAKESIEAAFNARFVARPETLPVITGFPDGAFETLVFPLPSDRLHELVDCLDAMDADPDIAAVVGAYVAMTQARIDYVQGRCPDVPDTPEALAKHSRNAVGLACYGLPQFETVGDNLSILAVNRWVYLVHVTCVFRDLARVVSHCHRHGFIGTSDNAPAGSAYPDGMEWTALVLPGGCEAIDAKLDYFDEEPTRRVSYGSFLPSERFPAIDVIRDVSRQEALRRLLAAEAWASSQPDVLLPEAAHLIH